MGIKNRAHVLTRWVSTPGRNDPEILDSIGPGMSISDATGQSDVQIPTMPNAYVVFVENLTAVQLLALQADTRIVVIATEAYEDTDNSPRVGGDRETRPNQASLTVLKTTIKTRFPDVIDADLTDDRDGGRDLFTAKNLTKGELAERIALRCKRYGKTRG